MVQPPKKARSNNTLAKKKAPPPPPKAPKKKTRSRPSIFLPFLFLLSVYSLWRCPHDYEWENPVCRGLGVYRTRVVDPGVAWAGVLVERGRRTEVGHKVEDALVRAQEEVLLPAYEKVALPAYEKGLLPTYHKVLVPAYYKVLVPTYYKVLVPTYHKVLVPTYHHVIIPASKRLGIYAQSTLRYFRARASPYTRRAQSLLRPYYSKLEPHIATLRIYANHLRFYADKARAQVVRGYPYAVRAWEASKPVWAAAQKAGRRVVREVGVMRRRWVDPHLAVMWAKVLELGGDKEHGRTTTFVAAKTTTAESVATPEEAASVLPESTDIPPSNGFISDELAEQLAVSAEAARAAVTPQAEAEPQVESSSPQLAESTVPESSTTASQVTPTEHLSLFDDITEQVAAAEPATPEPAVDDDLDAFLEQLGIAPTPTPSPTPEEESPSPPPPSASLTPEEIAAKRSAIKVRHAAHIDLITSKADSLAPHVRSSLLSIRHTAASSLASMHLVDALKRECDTLLAGLQRFVGKERFAEIAGKVRETFGGRTSEYQERVIGVVQRARQEEVDLCMDAAGQVKKLADRAQADLGLDYAWLEDVTYLDWKEYHALKGLYEDFRDQMKLIQENTHPRPEEDVLNEKLGELQDELRREVALCVERIGEVESRAKVGVLKTDPEAFVGRDKVEVEEALAGVPLESDATPEPVLVDEPVVSILPIDVEEPVSILPIEVDEPVDVTEPQASILPIDVDEPRVSILPVGQPFVHQEL